MNVWNPECLEPEYPESECLELECLEPKHLEFECLEPEYLESKCLESEWKGRQDSLAGWGEAYIRLWIRW